MDVVLGISAAATEVTAALIDPELPQLGPLDERVTALRPGADIGDSVATAVGVMILRAERNDLRVGAVVAAHDTVSQRDAIARALEDRKIAGVLLVQTTNPELTAEYPPSVAAAVWGWARPQVLDEPLPVAVPKPVDSRVDRRGLALVIGGIAAAVVAGGVAVWAVAGIQAPENAGVITPQTSSTSQPTTSAPNQVSPPPQLVPGTEGDPTAPSVVPGVTPENTGGGIVIDESEYGTPSDPAYTGSESSGTGTVAESAARAVPTASPTRASRPTGNGGGGGGATQTEPPTDVPEVEPTAEPSSTAEPTGPSSGEDTQTGVE